MEKVNILIFITQYYYARLKYTLSFDKKKKKKLLIAN